MKLRTVWMPAETGARCRDDREIYFPAGTTISKTFHYELAGGDDGRSIRVVKADREISLDKNGELDFDEHFPTETRLLVRHEEGWKAFPYVWNAEPEDSILLFRMEDTEPAIVMPELGRASNQIEGAAVVRSWINSLAGTC